MSALFIEIEIEDQVAKSPEIAKKLEEVCPVSIFAAKDTGVEIVEENLDECTLCDLCLAAAPEGSLRIVKLYES